MIFIEDHPEIAGRDCEDCREYVYGKNGQKMMRQDGTPEPRPIPPNCDACLKHAPDVETLTPQNMIAYKDYVLCKELGCLPFPGGTESQDPVVMIKFETLAMIDRHREIAYAKAGLGG